MLLQESVYLDTLWKHLAVYGVALFLVLIPIITCNSDWLCSWEHNVIDCDSSSSILLSDLMQPRHSPVGYIIFLHLMSGKKCIIITRIWQYTGSRISHPIVCVLWGPPCVDIMFQASIHSILHYKGHVLPQGIFFRCGAKVRSWAGNITPAEIREWEQWSLREPQEAQ